MNEFSYPVARRTLDKWCESLLTEVETDGDRRRFFFRFDGSTCNNGGTPFSAFLHAEIIRKHGDIFITKAWIEIPEDQKSAAALMCAVPNSGEDAAEIFFRQLAAPADFVGRKLEDVIMEEVPLNYAGCFCGKAHVNQKWKIALSTIHFAMAASA